jgi:hypothetical protein
MLELLAVRERGSRRDTRLQGILQFIHTNVWRALFGRVRLACAGLPACAHCARPARRAPAGLFAGCVRALR